MEGSPQNGSGSGVRARARRKRGPAGRASSLYLLHNLSPQVGCWHLGAPPGACLSGSTMPRPVCGCFPGPLLGSQIPILFATPSHRQAQRNVQPFIPPPVISPVCLPLLSSELALCLPSLLTPSITWSMGLKFCGRKKRLPVPVLSSRRGRLLVGPGSLCIPERRETLGGKHKSIFQ